MNFHPVDRSIDITVTLICWCYFIFGFLFFFSFFYITLSFSPRSEYFIQRLNRRFYRGFFVLLKTMAPRQKWTVDAGVENIHSSVVVCNHLSYLDPLLLISSLEQAKTIVKPTFFSVPIFGWILRKAGYFPAVSSGTLGSIMLKQMETMAEYLRGGGNLFIFPQGTRSRDGKIGALNPGAFKIARYCGVPVHVLYIHNTDRLFTPGKFFFFTRRPNHISLRIVDTIHSDQERLSAEELGNRVRQGLEAALNNAEQHHFSSTTKNS
jgi:1-acyl-sn-glycerol-3-phosphate acyltransferase